MITIDRVDQNDYQTEGILRVNGTQFSCKTLELPWRDNQRSISRIPAGEYEGHLHNAPRFGQTVWIRDVRGRSEILIHHGNYNRDTLGCVLVGKDFVDMDRDGQYDVTDSKNTMNALIALIKNTFDTGERFKVLIRDRFPKGKINPITKVDKNGDS